MPQSIHAQDADGLARSHLFTVRLWLEELGGGCSEWRGKVQHVVSGEVRYFHDWPGLVACIQEMLDNSLK